jgi:hypothetical protein
LDSDLGIKFEKYIIALMNFKILFSGLAFILVISCYAQNFDSYTANFNKFEITASLLIKKNSSYAESNSLNTINKYNLTTGLSSQLDLLCAYKLNNKIKVYSGIGIAGNDFAYEFDFKGENQNFKFTYELGITSFKIPIRIGYKVGKYVEILGGISINFNENTSYTTKLEFGGNSTDTSIFSYDVPSSEGFPSFNSLSANLGINIYTKTRFRFFAIGDFDFGYYPTSKINSTVTINNNKSEFDFIGKSKFYYVSGGVSFLIFKDKKN